jgi:choline dehydrogenase-like flavoprotein
MPMAPHAVRKHAEVAVVGSGPGGATVARQLARAGKKVILLERGRDYRRKVYYGTYWGALTYADRHGLLLVLTIFALGKRLANHLLTAVNSQPTIAPKTPKKLEAA